MPIPRSLLPHSCSGRVIRACLNGEEVAVKEIKLDRAVEVRNAFVAVRTGGCCGEALQGCFKRD